MQITLIWLAVQAWFKKVGAWCKKYWQILRGAAIPIMLTLIFRKRGDLSNILDRINDDYKKEIDVIENQHATEIEKRENAQKLYLETIERLEEEYENASETLDSNKKKKIKELIEKYKDDPDGLANEIAELTGMKRV